MSRKIYLPALQLDVKYLWNKYVQIYSIKRIETVAFLLSFYISLFVSWMGFYFFFIIIVMIIILQYRRYRRLKQEEERGKAIFFKKKEKERKVNFNIFALCLFITWVVRSDANWLFFMLMISAYWLSRYFFYIPSIVFVVKNYSLIMNKGFKQKKIDFSYPNSLRFVYNMIVFDHPIDGKISLKGIKLDVKNMNSFKTFLSDNIGREMIISPTTGQPII